MLLRVRPRRRIRRWERTRRRGATLRRQISLTTRTPCASPRGATEDQADPEAAIPALLDAISACRTHDDSACPESVAPDSTGVVDALASVDPDSSETDLVDEYGDVAVIRLTIGQPEEKTEAASGTPVALMVVLIRTAEKWLVRDVYDVADQPG